MSISFNQAKMMAEEAVRGLAEASGDAFDIESYETIDEGWLFFYNSKEFIETGNLLARLAGNGPIFVDRSGAVKALSSGIP